MLPTARMRSFSRLPGRRHACAILLGGDADEFTIDDGIGWVVDHAILWRQTEIHIDHGSAFHCELDRLEHDMVAVVDGGDLQALFAKQQGGLEQ